MSDKGLGWLVVAYDYDFSQPLSPTAATNPPA